MNWKDNIKKVTPYTPGEQPKRSDIIKLNTNENPYPPSPSVAAVLADYAKNADRVSALRKYPDPECRRLREALGRTYGFSCDEVFVGVGSDDVLAMSFLTFFNSQKPVLFPDITYSFYDVWAELFDIPYERIPLRDDFTIDISDYDRECGGIVVANPNAPTGEALPLSDIERLLRAHPECIVIVDEAYVDFGGESAMGLIKKYENLLVIGTFSKSRSLAGCRIGFAFGGSELISALSGVKFAYNSYTMDSLTLAIGEAALSDDGYFDECISRIIATRERIKERLVGMGFTVADSRTNFLFVHHGKVKAKELFLRLKDEGIYVRYFDRERIDDHLRISIGTDEEMDVLCDALYRMVSQPDRA